MTYKKQKLLFFIFFFFSFIFSNNVSAQENIFLQEGGYFFQNDSEEYFLGKKKLDEQVLSEIAPSHQITYITDLFTNNQESLHSQVLSEYSDERVNTYKSLYYPITLSGAQNITSIKDFLGNEMNFVVSNEEDNTHIRLYYDSFMESVQINRFGSMVEDLLWKYGNEYISRPAKISIELSDESVLEFDFKFYTPEFIIQNQSFENNYLGKKYFLIGEDNKLSFSYSGEVNIDNIYFYELPWDSNVNEMKDEITFENFGKEKFYTTFLGEYDFVSFPLEILQVNEICEDTDRENIKIYFYDGETQLQIFNDFNEFTLLNTEVNQYNFTQKAYQAREDINIGVDEYNINFSGELSTGLYNLKITNYSTLKQDICKQALDIDKKDYIFNQENIVTQNFPFVVKDQQFYSVLGIKDIFYDWSRGGFNSYDSEKLEFLDLFEYSVKTLSGEVITTNLDKECLGDYDCYNLQRDAILNHFLSIGKFEELIYDIKYKFFFESEITHTFLRIDTKGLAQSYGNEIEFIHLEVDGNQQEYDEEYSYISTEVYSFLPYKDTFIFSVENKNNEIFEVQETPNYPDPLENDYYYEIYCNEWDNYCSIDFIFRNGMLENLVSFTLEYGENNNLTSYFGQDIIGDTLDEELQDKKQKSSDNNIFTTQHFFMNTFSGVLFARKIETEYVNNYIFDEAVSFTFDAEITGEDIQVDYNKLFVCETQKKNDFEISFGQDCYSIQALQSQEKIFQGDVFLYGLSGVISGEGKNFNTLIQIQSIPKYFPTELM